MVSLLQTPADGRLSKPKSELTAKQIPSVATLAIADIEDAPESDEIGNSVAERYRYTCVDASVLNVAKYYGPPSRVSLSGTPTYVRVCSIRI